MKVEKNPNDQMTPLERKFAIEHGLSYDRIPCVPFIGNMRLQFCNVAENEYLTSPQYMAEAEILAFNRFGFDRLSIGPNTRSISTAIAQQIPPLTGYKKVLDDYGNIDRLSPIIARECSEIQKFFQTAEMLMENAGNIVPVEASIGGPITIASFLRPIELLLRDCLRAPEKTHHLMRLIVDSQKSVIDTMAEYGVGIAMADPVANPALIGPRFYEQFVFPYTKELTDYAYEKTGKKVSLHMCGQTKSIWNYMSQYSLNEISLDNIVDLDLAAIELGKHVPIAGNVNPVEVMLNGTREDIFVDVKKCIDAGRKSEKGFHLTTGCDLPDGTSIEKMDWFMEAARQYGAYK